MARQPILDPRGRVHGYELLFRNGPEAVFSGDGNLATRTMIDNTVLFGLDRLTGGLPAFVNCTTESLIEQLVDVLPPSMTVLEILETLDPTPSLIAACRKLKVSGFRLALDDFVWKPELMPLVEIADYIKVDFLVMDAKERQGQLRRLRGSTVALVAEKVETQEVHQQAGTEGFTLFQGFYFCRPVLLKGRKVPANRLSQIQILELLQHTPLNLNRLSELLKRDASLTFRLLRLVNSPVCAMRQEVRSIQTALIMVGDDTFRRIATLAIASEFNTDQPPEVLRMAFTRGRFCELVAEMCALDPTEQYLLGMLSLLPAMLRLPMEELTPALPLRNEIRQALQGTVNCERCMLEWIEFHEQGNWAACDAVAQANGFTPEAAIRCYGEALVWAESAIQFSA
jgi:EAL and modified HD-GYP domain-containing signal transduction protein